jgi:hypothetical protein
MRNSRQELSSSVTFISLCQMFSGVTSVYTVQIPGWAMKATASVDPVFALNSAHWFSPYFSQGSFPTLCLHESFPSNNPRRFTQQPPHSGSKVTPEVKRRPTRGILPFELKAVPFDR